MSGDIISRRRRRRSTTKAKEQPLVNAVIRYLGLRGFFIWRQNQGGVRYPYKGRTQFVRFAHVDGISDVIGIAPNGRFVAVECKIAPRKPTEKQRQFLREVERLGGIAILAYSLDDVVEAVAEGKIEPKGGDA